MYTIKRVAELVGVQSDTIRVWERRYGVPSPQRSPSGYRLYSAEDVGLLRRMRELVEGGTSPSQAAALLREAPEPPQSSVAWSPEDLVARLQSGEWPQAELASSLRLALARGELAEAADAWLMPLLVEVGRAWARGSISMLHEHAVSATVLRELSTAYEDAGPQAGPRVLLGLARSGGHEIGVLLFAVLLRRAGIDAHYLGAHLTVGAWLDAVAGEHPALVVTACHRPADVEETRELAGVLGRLQGVRVAVGGSHQDDVEGAERLGHRFAPAVDRVRDWLRQGE